MKKGLLIVLFCLISVGTMIGTEAASDELQPDPYMIVNPGEGII